MTGFKSPAAIASGLPDDVDENGMSPKFSETNLLLRSGVFFCYAPIVTLMALVSTKNYRVINCFWIISLKESMDQCPILD